MTAREFELLRVLVQHPRQVFSREHLFELVWGSYGDRSAVSVYVSRLREKIEDDPADPRYIVTVWGAGYRFDGGPPTRRSRNEPSARLRPRRLAVCVLALTRPRRRGGGRRLPRRNPPPAHRPRPPTRRRGRLRRARRDAGRDDAVAAGSDREAHRARTERAAHVGLTDQQALHLREHGATARERTASSRPKRPAVSRRRPTCSRSPAARARASGSICSLPRSIARADCSSRSRAGSPRCSPARCCCSGRRSRWLVAPLRRLSAQVDAIAGGDPIETRATSPIREVENVATAVAGMAARLAQTAEQDARLEAERRLLVSSIAHDLRTPLFSLRGYLDAIATGIGNPHERLDRAREKAQQIDRLVTGLFDYARAEIDERPRLQTTDLAEAVATATAAFELAADERGVELRVAAHTRSPVTIDRDGFERALANVLDNALRHTPARRHHRHHLRRRRRRRLRPSPRRRPRHRPRPPPPHLRADGPRQQQRRTGGTGLGLTIAARLLRNQGGTIDAANAPGHGAILTLRLPSPSAGTAVDSGEAGPI